MTPSDNASDQAKARLAALEADPKHTSHPDPKAVEQTLHGSLDDPKHQGKPFDPADPGKWHGNDDDGWDSPDFEE